MANGAKQLRCAHVRAMHEDAPRRRRNIRSPLETGIALTPRQRALLALLDPKLHFKYLTSTWLHAFIGGNDDAFKRMLRKLYDAGYLDRPHQQRATANANYKALVYERTTKAADLFAMEKTANARSGSYAHELLVDLGFYAPLHWAVHEDPMLQIYDAAQLLAGAEFRIRPAAASSVVTLALPPAIRDSADPFRLLLRSGQMLRFDGTPFVLQRRMNDGALSSIFVPGIEVDRGTEPFEGSRSSDTSRTTLTKHIDHIACWFKERGFLHHYGMRMMLVPILTTSEVRMRGAMTYVQRTLGPCRFFLFKTVPDIAHLDHFPTPESTLFLSPWQRVGHSPFTFDERGFA